MSKTIIDLDIGVDDCVALLYVLMLLHTLSFSSEEPVFAPVTSSVLNPHALADLDTWNSLALASPELDIVAITCVYGNTLVERVAENLNKTFHVLSKSISSEDEGRQRWPGMYGQKPILVGKKGADEPIAGEREVAAYFVSASSLVP